MCNLNLPENSNLNSMNKLPLARTQDILMQDLGNEILLYDLTINKAFCLNQTTSIVFKYCDGNTSFADLRLKEKDLSDEVIYLTLDLLQKENLLKFKDYQADFNGLSRREVIRKVGLASMVALPVISTLIAPNSVMALSCAPGLIAPGDVVGAGCVPGVSCAVASATCCDGIGPGNCCTGSAKFGACSDVGPPFNCAQCACTCD